MHVKRVDFIAMPVADLARADAFYGETLGLARNPHTSGDRWVEYETGNLTLALSTFGGSLALGVDDIDAARAELEGQGTNFVMDTFDSGVCNGAPFTDPDGNTLQLHRRYAPLEHFDVPEQEILRTDFIGVNVKDRAAASAFYEDKLGLPRNQVSHDEWPEYDAGNVVLLTSTPEQKNGGEYKPHFDVALRVADVEKSMARLKDAGVEFLFPEVYDSGVCHMAFFTDPDGNGLILHHRYAAYSDGSRP